MAGAVKSVLKALGWIIGSILIGFIITMIIVMPFESRLSELPFGEATPYVLWGAASFIAMVPLRRMMNRLVKIQKKGVWESPEQIRDKVINAPQFVGRLDREKGVLECTARMVTPDYVYRSSWFKSGQDQYSVVSFRAELLDQSGSPLDFIPVRIEAETSKFVGQIVDGDRVRVEGKFEKDGILHATSAFNFSTNSWVGHRE